MPVAEVDTFAGIDVSAHELSVALRRGQGHDKPAMAKFPNHPSGHKALVAYLLRSGGRVRVCLEASGNYSLDLAFSPEPLGWLAPPKSTRAWEPTLSWNQLHQLRIAPARDCGVRLRSENGDLHQDRVNERLWDANSDLADGSNRVCGGSLSTSVTCLAS
jgi:hypothetical protein